MQDEKNGLRHYGGKSLLAWAKKAENARRLWKSEWMLR
jgi:hypothetical protein